MKVKWIRPGEDYADAAALRTEVFVEEQGFPLEVEMDELDAHVHHIVLYNEEGRPVACGRIFPAPEDPEIYILGRIAVKKILRGTGTGRLLMAEMEKEAAALGAKRAGLGAQCQAQGFYAKAGYSPRGEIYLEEDCPHIHMEKIL